MAGFDMYLDIFHNQKEAIAASLIYFSGGALPQHLLLLWFYEQ